MIVNVNAEPPVVTAVGFKVVMADTGLPTIKFRSAELPPPGVGVNTENFNVFAATNSAAVKVTCSWVAELTVVARSAPLTRTMEFERKSVPVIVTMVCGLPIKTEFGLRFVSVGAG